MKQTTERRFVQPFFDSSYSDDFRDRVLRAVAFDEKTALQMFIDGAQLMLCVKNEQCRWVDRGDDAVNFFRGKDQ